MSLNTAHLNGGVLIHSGECILLYCEGVNIEWSGNDHPAFNGTKSGRIYLTTHRVIFNNKSMNDGMQSFSLPFITLSEVEIEQPIFGANYLKGKVRAQPNGNWVGEAKFKMTFKKGGAIEFGQAMLKAATLATRFADLREPPPPYVPPGDQWYAAPPQAYAPPPQGYYGWAPPTNVFPDRPPQDGVYVNDAPPPYPGIVPGQQQNGAAPGGYPQAGGYAPQPGGYAPPQQQGGYAPPQQQGGYAPQPGYGGYPPQGAYPPQGYPPGYSPQGFQGAAGGPQPGMSPADAKAAEAAQSAYYDPNRPQMAYVPPPAYYENPPSYTQATKKEQ